ncbi:MAG: FAD-dependent oxidoreductase [Synergistaceae bacterium]|nr:FAD-dependent oxidoreductase [Synergistaceae bacterium]
MKIIFKYILIILLSQSIAHGAEIYDVVIVGGGASGVVAAIQAARMGVNVAIVEESGWIGGQATGAGVATMDDNNRTRFGLYGEFIERAAKYYKTYGKSVSTGMFGAGTISFEPAVGQKIFYEMLKEAGRVDVRLNSRAKAAILEGNRVVGARFQRDDLFPFELRAHVFIDATEQGDFIPLTGAKYRAGNCISPALNLNAQIQDMTQVAIIKRWSRDTSGEMPDKLKINVMPPEYENYVDIFRNVVAVDGSSWGAGGYPFDVPSHNAYRGLPDIDCPLPVDNSDPNTWANITRTGINWANDYPHSNREGLTVRYLEDRAHRKEVNRRAALRTLQFIYYYQNELNQSDWTVDISQGYDEGFINATSWQTWIYNDDEIKDMGKIYGEVLKHFPPFPYVRESRRLLGLYTLRFDDVKRVKKLGRATKNFPSSMALGEYQVDLHAGRANEFLESELDEDYSKFPTTWVGSEGIYQVPFEVFIPETVDGLIAAEKNISVSRMVNGTTRLHPIVMHVGQAAGTIAALSAKERVNPRELVPFDVQIELWQSGAHLSLYDKFDDVPVSSKYWRAVQAATLYGWMPQLAEGIFGADLPLTKTARIRLESSSGVKLPGNIMSRGEAVEFVMNAKLMKD